MESCGCLEEASKDLSLKEALEAGHKYPGLPAPLPPGEHIVWQGIPDWLDLARQTYHIGFVALYFIGYAIWRAMDVISIGGTIGDAIFNAALLLIAGAVAVGLLCLISHMMSNATIYTITNKRIVFRFGAAFPKSIDIPFKTIVSANLQRKAKGRGNISFALKAGNRAPFFVMWPHVRPFHFNSPQPTLRALPDAESVAEVLAEKLRAAAQAEIDGSDVIAEAKAIEEAKRAEEARLAALPKETDQVLTPEQRFGPAYAIMALLVLTVAGVGIFQATKDNRAAANRAPLTVYDLRINDLGDDRFALISNQAHPNLALNEQVSIVEPGKDGVIRGAIKGLTRTREIRRMDPAASFQLVVWDTGHLTFSDMELDRHYPLDSFGRAGSGAINDLRRLKAEALAPVQQAASEKPAAQDKKAAVKTTVASIGSR